MKKFAILTLGLTLLLGTHTFAAENVSVELPAFPITLNETTIDNSKEVYPFIQYKGITYLPMTWANAQAMSLSTQWSQGSGLNIDSVNRTKIPDVQLQNTANNNMSRSYKASIPDFPIKVNGDYVDNGTETYPLLSYKDITYFPMTWKYMVETFGAEYSWSEEAGLNVMTKAKKREKEVNLSSVDLNADFFTMTTSISKADLDQGKKGVAPYFFIHKNNDRLEIVTHMHKNNDLDGYRYDQRIRFFDENDNILFDLVGSVGVKYFSKNAWTVQDLPQPLTEVKDNYSRVEVHTTFYTQDHYAKLNAQAAELLKVEYIDRDDFNKELATKVGGVYVRGMFAQPYSNTMEESIHYTLLRYTRTFDKDGKPEYHPEDNALSTGLYMEKLDQIDSYTIQKIDGKYKLTAGNDIPLPGHSMLVLDANYVPIKLYVNKDAFENKNDY